MLELLTAADMPCAAAVITLLLRLFYCRHDIFMLPPRRYATLMLIDIYTRAYCRHYADTLRLYYASQRPFDFRRDIDAPRHAATAGLPLRYTLLLPLRFFTPLLVTLARFRLFRVIATRVTITSAAMRYKRQSYAIR